MILLTGADGFVGRHVLAGALTLGVRVRAMVLPGPQQMHEVDGLEWVHADIRDAAAVRAAMDGISRIVHLAAIVASADPSLNHAVNVQGTANLIAAAKDAGVKSFVFMSAAAAKFKTLNAYGRSKREAEAIVMASGMDHLILRTPLIIGSGGEEWERFVDYVGKIPGLVPVFGPGRALKRPVDISDVAEAIMRIVDWPVLGGRVLELACRQLVSLDQLIDMVAAAQNRRVLKVHLPLTLSFMLSGAAEAILGHRTPITRDIVRGLNENVEFAVDETLAALGFEPMSPTEAIAASITPTH